MCACFCSGGSGVFQRCVIKKCAKKWVSWAPLLSASSWKEGSMGRKPIGFLPMPGDRCHAVARPWDLQVGDRIPTPRCGVIRPPITNYQRKSVRRTDVSSRQLRIIPYYAFLRRDNSSHSDFCLYANSSTLLHSACIPDDVPAAPAALRESRALHLLLLASRRSDLQ
jgi:hypothetical protein